MQSVTINQEFKNIIPPQTVEEHAGLEASILAEGCRDSLIVWGGVLVDGHNRYEICTRLNLPYKTEEKYFPSPDHVVEWIINNQLSRRNITVYDRTRLVLRQESIIQARAKANQQLSEGRGKKGMQETSDLIQPITTREELAKLAGTSHDTIRKVKVIESEATPEQKADLSSGKKKVGTVFKEIEKKTEAKMEVKEKPRKEGNPSVAYNPNVTEAMQFCLLAMTQMDRIRKDDPQRVDALKRVITHAKKLINLTGE